MSWSWRTKPRSIIKTVQWFPYFAALHGQNWDETASNLSRFDNKPIHPVRRAYIYEAHSDEDSWLSSISYNNYLSGQNDNKETESNGRNDKTTFEFFGFGYVDKHGIIRVTDIGNKIVQGSFDSEDYLKQLLKLRLPNIITKTRDNDNDLGVFPFRLILLAFSKFESLNRSELALLFGCIRDNDADIAIRAISEFKDEYTKLDNKNDTFSVKNIYERTFIKYYGSMPNMVDSYYDYAEALSRTLVYTGLFTLSGRSIASKVRVAEHSKTKVRMLQEKYEFRIPEDFLNVNEYMEWYGSTKNVRLPWENIEDRRNIITEKADILTNKLASADYAFQKAAQISAEEIEQILKNINSSTNINELKYYEDIISGAIVEHNEEYFIKILSKTKEERDNILDKFDDILDNIDMSALWLEVNTWKSLIAINGGQFVKRNFKIEDDLTPRSFAPGVGNTPDMVLYKNGYIIVPEVSLMTGVRQWEHEASSVVDHVLSFILDHQDKKVLGLFISSRLYARTIWQLFILNRESWLGAPVPVIPLTINKYMEIIKFIYDYDLDIDDFYNLIDYLSKITVNCETYNEWESNMDAYIESWKKSKTA